MKDENKTKAQLIKELKQTRNQVKKLNTDSKSGTDTDTFDKKDQIMQMITDNVSVSVPDLLSVFSFFT